MNHKRNIFLVLALFALLIAACSPYGPQHDVVVVVEETPEAVETEVVEIDPEQAGGNDHEQEIHGIGSQIATSEKCLEERPMYNGLTPIHNAYRYTYSFNEACARIFGFADHAEAIVANNARLAQPTAIATARPPVEIADANPQGLTQQLTQTAPLTTTIPTLIPSDGNIWGDSWRGAGLEEGCAEDVNATTEWAQQTLRVPVVRISDRACAWAWNGQPMSFMLPSNQWVMINLDGGQPQLIIGSGQVVSASYAQIHFLGGYPQGTTPQRILAHVNEYLGEGCILAPEVTEERVSRLISVEPNNPVRVQFMPGSTNGAPSCEFNIRGVNAQVRVPEGFQATIHPFGDDGVHAGGVDDFVYMWLGDEDPNEIHHIWAATFRYVPGYVFLDDVYDPQRIWHKELANGLLDVNPFLVLPGNIDEPFDRELLQEFMTAMRPGSTAPTSDAIRGMMGGESINLDDPFRNNAG